MLSQIPPLNRWTDIQDVHAWTNIIPVGKISKEILFVRDSDILCDFTYSSTCVVNFDIRTQKMNNSCKKNPDIFQLKCR